ncbi:MAG: oligoendopeptidase F [Tissierella sp.]|uniref:oligoendopeptidase F n=1 Tax=Tissierella sp. TaxID=41274 RepID=UPI003F973DC8
MIVDRKDVDKSLTWDLSAIFKTEKEYEESLDKMINSSKEIKEEFKGKLKDAADINNCLDKLRDLEEIAVLVYTFVSLNVSVDQTDTKNQERQMKFMSKYSNILSRLSFIESEIIKSSEDVIKDAIDTSSENKGHLEEILRKKEYALSADVEETLSSLSNILDTPYEIYNNTKLADMDFHFFEINSKKYPLSFINFEGEWEYSDNTDIRREAFRVFSKKLKEYKHTIATAYNAQVQKEKTISDLRGFNSVIDSLLFPQEVDRELYNRQIDLIMEHLAPHMRKYAKLLQRIHGLDKMTFADLKIDVDPDFEPDISVEDSKEYIKGALGVFGDEYMEVLNRAYDERWIDFVQNKGKSTGAFCSSPYGSHPFILISWTQKMREVFVLAHELGHAGHFYLAQKEQNIFDTDPSMYFVEAPSTMNEMLMANYLLKNTDDKRMRRWVLSSMISRTYYHNFVTHLLEAHFQREVYRLVDKGEGLHSDKLNNLKRKTLEKFWGDTVDLNEGAELTWMRQPHYYMGLYSYTYSAGLTIATEVSKRVIGGDKEALEDWKDVLKTGGSKTPLELAQMAGVDIGTDKALLDTIEHIGNIIDEIIKLTDEIERE